MPRLSDILAAASPRWARAARASALIAAAFSAAVGLLLLLSIARFDTRRLLDSPDTRALRQQYVASNDPAIAQRLREIDLALRQQLFDDRAFRTQGAWLLVLGVGVMFLSSRVARSLAAAPTAALAEAPTDDRRHAHWGRMTIAGLAMTLLGATLGLALTLPRPLPAPSTGGTADASGARRLEHPDAPAPVVSADVFAANWPAFRGHAGQSALAAGTLPSPWESLAPASARWTAPIDLPGNNSPIVWNQRVYLSAGDAATRAVYCFDLNDGRLLWRQTVSVPPQGRPVAPVILEDTGYAAATMATDGRAVFAIFATGELAAFSFDGKLLWTRHLGTPDNHYGHASSLVTDRHRLFVQLDQATEDDHKSTLLALNPITGVTLWSVDRPVGASWASPIVITAAGKSQLITVAVPWVIAYDTDTAVELWRAKVIEGEPAPSPSFSRGLVLVVNPESELIAIRPDGSGDVTATHVAWRATRNIPDISSPAANDQLIFLGNTSGELMCFHPDDGRLLWEHEFDGGFYASPLIVGDQLVLAGGEGKLILLRAAEAFEPIAVADLAQPLRATPVLAGDRLLVRAADRLFCFGSKP